MGKFYPVLVAIALIFSKCAGLGFVDVMAILYSGVAKNHILGITFATLVFDDISAVLPAVAGFLLQKPMMFFLFRVSNRIRFFFQPS